MNVTAFTRFSVPLAILAFAWVAWAEFGDLPARVPAHFDSSGAADRWAARKSFIGLNVITVILLGGALLAGRHYVRTEAVDADHVYSRQPHLRSRLLVVLDLVGGAALLLVAWFAHLCARAAHLPAPTVPRFLFLAPVALLLLAALLAALWTRPLWRPHRSRRVT